MAVSKVLNIVFWYGTGYFNTNSKVLEKAGYYGNEVNSAGKRDRLGLLVSSDKLLVTNRPKAAAEGSGLRSVSYPRNGRGPLPKAAARAPLGLAVFQKVEVRVAQFHS